MPRNYHLRYSVEEWNKPPGPVGRQVADGVTVSADDHGYCDDIFIASIMHKRAKGETCSVLLLGKDGAPSREVLELVRDAINDALREIGKAK